MTNPFFDHPILNSPYAAPSRYWELDETGQPTQRTLEQRRPANFITPIPKPRKRKQDAAQAEYEYLYDKPYDDKKKVRVAGPFTVESLSPHRMLGVNENNELIDTVREPKGPYAAKQSFGQIVLENLKMAGVQQAHKQDKIVFTALTPWPGELVCGEGRYQEGRVEKRAGIFIGPEFGTVARPDLVQAAREAADAGFDVLIACAFNFEAHTTEFNKLGRVPVLKARMNADLHMVDDLKNTGKGNLFVIFGEPDVTLLPEKSGRIAVKVINHLGDEVMKVFKV